MGNETNCINKERQGDINLLQCIFIETVSFSVTPDRVLAEKPALPAKPISPTRSPPSSLIRANPPTTATTASPTKNNDITSPALVNSLQKISEQSKKEPLVEDLVEDDDDEELIEEYPCGGIRERTLLCPIQEEDTESTASGSSLSVASKRQQSATTGSNNAAAEESNNKVIQEEVHDGHYFIRVSLKSELPCWKKCIPDTDGTPFASLEFRAVS